MGKHYPAWREARVELNELPLAAASWNGQRVGETPPLHRVQRSYNR